MLAFSKLNIVVTSLVCGIVVCTSIVRAEGRPESIQLPLLLLHSEAHISPGLADFFQAASTSLDDDPAWRRIPRTAVNRHLKLKLSDIPALQLQKLPGLNTGIIPEVQELVDTLALRGALLVSCVQTNNATKIKSCELLYYDASKTKVTSSAKKTFPVPLRDASQWAPRLLATLRQGIQQHREQAHQSQLRRALSATSASPSPAHRVLVQASGQGGRSGSSTPGLRTQSGLGLVLGLEADDKYAGLFYEQSQATNKSNNQTTRLQSTSYGLLVGVSSPAMTSLLWDLSFAIGKSERVESSRKSKASQEQVMIAIQPGLFWQFNKWFATGFHVGYRQFTGGRTTRTESASALKNATTNIGLAIRAYY